MKIERKKAGDVTILAERIGPSLVSRLNQMCQVIDIRAEDFRSDVKRVRSHSLGKV